MKILLVQRIHGTHVPAECNRLNLEATYESVKEVKKRRVKVVSRKAVTNRNEPISVLERVHAYFVNSAGDSLCSWREAASRHQQQSHHRVRSRAVPRRP